jgi:NADH:ubiquinone oxidoreductase subunit C
LPQDISRLDAIAAQTKERLGEAFLGSDRSFGDLTLIVHRASAHDLLATLKTEHGCDLLLDILGVDCLNLEDENQVARFEIEYILYGVATNLRVRVRIPVPESDLNVPTVTDLWQSANWAEREAFEMFGFNFVDHPCLKRLLTHHEFEGHPLRKDYPVMGGQWCTSTSDMSEELQEKQGGAPGGDRA